MKESGAAAPGTPHPGSAPCALRGGPRPPGGAGGLASPDIFPRGPPAPFSGCMTRSCAGSARSARVAAGVTRTAAAGVDLTIPTPQSTLTSGNDLAPSGSTPQTSACREHAWGRWGDHNHQQVTKSRRLTTMRKHAHAIRYGSVEEDISTQLLSCPNNNIGAWTHRTQRVKEERVSPGSFGVQAPTSCSTPTVEALTRPPCIKVRVADTTHAEATRRSTYPIFTCHTKYTGSMN